MKMKSLLAAAVAMMSLSAFATDYTDVPTTLSLPDGFKLEKNVERSDLVEITMNRQDNATNFTNLQITMLFPAGSKPVAISASPDTRVWDEDEDGYKAILSWSDNWPGGETNEYRAFAADMTKTPVTKNPLVLVRMRFQTTEEYNGGPITVSKLKYTDYEDNSYDCTVHTMLLPAVESAVEDINAGKAVAGVKYYNVAGVAADKAFDGVNIVVTTYADGTQNVVKVVK